MRGSKLQKMVQINPAPTKKKLIMKTRNTLMMLSVAVMTTVNALAVEPLFSPKASEQTRTVSGYNSDPNLAATGLQSAPPRVLESKSKTVAGKSTEVTPSLLCTRRMAGSPKMIGACADHHGDPMPCCATSASK